MRRLTPLSSLFSALCLALTLGAATPAGAEPQPEALLAAARLGDNDAVRTLLRAGSAIDPRDAAGNTPLLLATAKGHTTTALVLIEAGADVNLKNDMQDSAYLLAGARGELDIVRATIEHGANLKSTNRYGGTALIPACERGHVATVKLLLEAGVDPDHVNRLGWTGLLEAILLSDGGPRHQEIVALLIAHGADVNLPDGDGVSPLTHARQRGHTATARLLEQAGAR